MGGCGTDFGCQSGIRNNENPNPRKNAIIVGAALGGLVTVPAIIMAIASAGGGHGNYNYAKMLFPYTMLLRPMTGNSITWPLILLALAQFHLYGAMIGACGKRWLLIVFVSIVLLAAHLIAVWFCLSGVIPNFS
jgi:K+-transporting ATPase A subunit